MLSANSPLPFTHLTSQYMLKQTNWWETILNWVYVIMFLPLISTRQRTLSPNRRFLNELLGPSRKFYRILCKARLHKTIPQKTKKPKKPTSFLDGTWKHCKDTLTHSINFCTLQILGGWLRACLLWFPKSKGSFNFHRPSSNVSVCKASFTTLQEGSPAP